MKKNMIIRCSSTCPQKTTVLGLLRDGKANFLTAIGEKPLRGKFPLYIDSEDKANLYGMIEKIMNDDGSNLSNEEIEVLIAQKPQIVLKSISTANANMIEAELVLSEVQVVNVEKEYVPSERLQKVMDEKIAAGILTKEEMDARLDIMVQNKVDEVLKIRVISGYRKYNKSVHKPRCIYVDPFLDEMRPGEEGIISEGLRNGIRRMPCICKGEKSVGKNVYMETMAWLMGMPLYMITFSRSMNPNSIYGEKSTDNSASEKLMRMEKEAIAKVMVDANAAFKDEKSYNNAIKAAADFELQKARAASVSIVIDSSELYDWMIDGGVMVMNEMNMADANFFSSFANPLTDGTGFLVIPGRGEVPVHKDCVLFGTQNDDYEGTQQQNVATLSRFNGLYFKQPGKIFAQLKAATQAELIKDGFEDCMPPDKYFLEAQNFYNGCRKAVEDENDSSAMISNAVLNIRGFVRALTTVGESECVCKLSRWINICVIETCPSDERETLRAILQSIVTL